MQANIAHQSAQDQRKRVELRHYPHARQPLSNLLLRCLRDVHTGGRCGGAEHNSLLQAGLGRALLAVCPRLSVDAACPAAELATALPPTIGRDRTRACVHQHGHNQDLVDNTGCLCPCIMACIPAVHCCELTRARRNMRVRMGIKVLTHPTKSRHCGACMLPSCCYDSAWPTHGSHRERFRIAKCVMDCACRVDGTLTAA